VRRACIDAAIDGYEQAAISGLCHEGAWEAALSAIRSLPLGALDAPATPAAPAQDATAAPAPEGLGDATRALARRFASSGPPTAGSAAAAAGAIAAGLLEWSAALSARHGDEGRRKRARAIAGRAAALQAALGAAAQTDADRVEAWMRATRNARDASAGKHAPRDALDAATDSVLDVAARCAQVATLAAEVACEGHTAIRHDAVAALQLAASAAECALALAESNLGAAPETFATRNARRRIWRARLLLGRARPASEGARADSDPASAPRSPG